MIWVSCDGENSADREHIGNVTYTPFRGFPTYYFPYKNIPGYLSPIVALQFQKPEGIINYNMIFFLIFDYRY
jgi:sodium/potassium-transporting ATPase subunit beta